MTDENAMRVSGDLLATSAAAIGAALAPVFPTATVEVSTEVAIEADTLSFAIYPDRDAPEGGSDFLVSGNLWLESDAARETLQAITAALSRANIACSLELSRTGASSHTVANERFHVLCGGRALS
jgi:hypothetical protein